MAEMITIHATINAPVEKVWTYYTDSKHIVKWNNASEDWHTPWAKNDLKVGGKFVSRMEAKDKSMGFDFTGTYTKVEPHKHIDYTMEDGRTVKITFTKEGTKTVIKVVFEAENENPIEMQRGGWQSILDNFKKYIEKN